MNTIDIDSSNLENEQSKCIIKEIKVNDIDTCAFIDSGSNKTLIRESFAKKVGKPIQSSTILNGFLFLK